jgi:hypothetical protein
MDYNYPIAIGLKADSHDNLEAIIGKDIQLMKNTQVEAILGGSHPKAITFSAEMFVSLGDQPERRGANFLLGGTSRSHCRWRYACDIQKVRGVLPACQECLSFMKEIDTETYVGNGTGVPPWLFQCDRCTNWMITDLDNPLLAYAPPKDYPKGYLLGGVPGDGDTINPIKITYASLKNVIHLTHTKIVSGAWSKLEGTIYLKANGVKTSFATAVVNCAMKCGEYREALDNYGNDKEAYDLLENDRQKNPSKYIMKAIPSVWRRDVPLRLFIDTPMHLLFLGIAKSIFFYIGIWSNKCGRGPAFRKIAQSMLIDLDALKLQWLSFNVTSFMTWGGWVSEKYQSLSRVALWIYGPLLVLDDIPAFEPPKNRNIDQWLIDHYRKWLKVRGLTQEGTKDELREKVKHYLSLPETEQPPLLPPDYGKAGTVLEVLRSMVVMMTTLLQPAVEGESHARILGLRIRIFLNAVEEFERPLRKKKKQKRGGEVEEIEVPRPQEMENIVDAELLSLERDINNNGLPLWIRSYNYMSLLNLPDILKEFGSVRNYFEGKYLGERFVQEVKNARKQCPPRNITGTLLKKIHEGKALESIMQTQSPTLKTFRLTEAKNPKKRYLVGNVRIYRCKNDAMLAFHANKPISILESVDYGFGLLFYCNGSNRGEVSFWQIIKMDHMESIYNGLRYWKWELTDTILKFDSWEVKDFAVLLPKTGNETNGEYTIITKEWSPIMLEHYAYAKVGMDVKAEVKLKDTAII